MKESRTMTIGEAMRLRKAMVDAIQLAALDFCTSTGLECEVTASAGYAQDGSLNTDCHVDVRLPELSVLATDNLKQ